MKKRKICLVQPNYLFGDTAYLPYAAGAVAAYAFGDDFVSENYSLSRIIYLREDIDETINSLDEPFLAGFSNYIWNFEYNKEFAKKLKKRFPDCVILFGGHNVPPGAGLLSECAFIDILAHGQGEETFRQILSALAGRGRLGDVGSISFRTAGGLLETTASRCQPRETPSPILGGVFDEIMSRGGMKFTTVIETNRGCPFNCSYCDWGGEKSGVIKYPMERIFAEIDWAAKNKIEHLGCADSNFGIFERDAEIAAHIISANKKTGYPKKFRVSYAKNSNKTVFKICKALNECGMSKGASLSFQSLNPDALAAAGRENMGIERFHELMSMYESAGIPTYSELIIGLPGETKESFIDGIDKLLNAGQHTSLYVYFCELLVNSRMASPEYLKKYKIRSARVPLNQSHCEPVENDIQEYSSIVVSTSSMSAADWVETNLFSVCVQCFHCFALLQFFAIYARLEKGLSYVSFYGGFLKWMSENRDAICSLIFGDIEKRLESVVLGNGSLQITDSRFGTVSWPFEEAAFLQILYERERFYDEIFPFLLSLGIDGEVFEDLLRYQKGIVKQAGVGNFEIKLVYDWSEYFENVYKGRKAPLKKIANTVQIGAPPPRDYADFAREIVWYGRKGSNMLHRGDAAVKREEEVCKNV
jgi:radical SAM superfamily enzyme YgiQ (UPF0313 family)